MFVIILFNNLIVGFIKLITLGIFFISVAILYFSKGLARLIENVYKAYKVEKFNENKLDNKTIEKEENSFDIER